jgi:uncharacterized protein
MLDASQNLTVRDRENSSSEWSAILAFIVLVNVVGCVACFSFRSSMAEGHLWAFFAFVFVTVWSPTVIAVILSLIFEGTRGARRLLGLLFRRLSDHTSWYLIGLLVPVASVALAVTISRHFHQGAPFIQPAALPLTMTLQLFTGAMGEELGWRGFLLPRLQSKFSPRVAAIIMGITWALWHLPSFYFPGMAQQQMPMAAFLLMVAAFGIFLALLFNRTNGHVLSTMMAHFSFNMSLAAGGAILGSVLIWALAAIFSVVALACLGAFMAIPTVDIRNRQRLSADDPAILP